MLPHCECSDAVETDICFVSHTATYIRDDPKFIFFHILTAHCATLLMTDSQNGSSKPTKPKAKSWICTWIQILAKGSIFTFSFIPTENDVSPSPWLLPDLLFIIYHVIYSWQPPFDIAATSWRIMYCNTCTYVPNRNIVPACIVILLHIKWKLCDTEVVGWYCQSSLMFMHILIYWLDLFAAGAWWMQHCHGYW